MEIGQSAAASWRKRKARVKQRQRIVVLADVIEHVAQPFGDGRVIVGRRQIVRPRPRPACKT